MLPWDDYSPGPRIICQEEFKTPVHTRMHQHSIILGQVTPENIYVCEFVDELTNINARPDELCSFVLISKADDR